MRLLLYLFQVTILLVTLGRPLVVHGQSLEESAIPWLSAFHGKLEEISVEEAIQRTQTEMIDAREISDPLWLSQLHKEMGLIFLQRAKNPEKALEHFIHAASIEDSLGLDRQRLENYYLMAKTFKSVGNYFESLDFVEEALQRNIENQDLEILLLIESGELYVLTDKLEQATESYHSAIRKSRKNNQRMGEASALFKLGEVQTNQKEYEQALETQKTALVLQRQMGRKREEAANLLSIGDLYRLQQNPDRALANFVASLEIYRELADQTGLAKVFNKIGQFYLINGNPDRALANLELGLASAQQVQFQEEIRNSYRFLSDCYRMQRNYKMALEFQDLYVAMNEFIQNEKNERQLLETQNQYELDKKEEQIDLLESSRRQKDQELAAKNQFEIFLFVVIAFFLVLSFIISYLFYQKRKANIELDHANQLTNEQNRKLEELNSTKDKFFSIIGHDLKGPINSLSSFSSLLINHTDSMSKEEIKMLAVDINKSLKNLYALLENLLNWARSQTGKIDLTPEKLNLNELLDENRLLLEAQAQSKDISISVSVKDEIRGWADRNSVSTVIRNLISNAIKFTRKGGHITLQASLTENEVQVSIRDDGVGMPKEIRDKLFRIDSKVTTKGTSDEKGTGLGLVLCREFIEKNGGKIWVESELHKGSTFSFTLPSQA